MLKERGIVVDVNFSRRSLYNKIRDDVMRYGNKKSVGAMTIAACIAPLDYLKRVQEHFRRQVAKYQLTDTYEKVRKLLEQSAPVSDILACLDFKSPYVLHSETERKCVYERRVYQYRNGVYIILDEHVEGEQEKKVVYVGQSVGAIYQTLYNHFTPYLVDRPTRHYHAVYSHTFESPRYSVAIIDVPGLLSLNGLCAEVNEEDLKKYVKYLETQLIQLFPPEQLDNVKDLAEQLEVPTQVEEPPPF